jgi:GT2 family glycosyltransferase
VLTPASRWPTRLPDDTTKLIVSNVIPRRMVSDDARRDDGQSAAVSIVVVTSNNLVYTRLCLESVLANTEPDTYEVIVVDNGSRDQTASYLRDLASEHVHVRLIVNDTNLGFVRATNQGVAIASGDVLVLLNDDTIVPSGWLPRLVAYARDSQVGLVGPVSNRTGNEAEIEGPYNTYGEFLQFAHDHVEAKHGKHFDIPVATMFCTAMRRDVYDTLGPLDEQFEIGLFEDDDYSMRARAAGYRVVCAEDVFVHHFGQASFGKLASSDTYGRLFEANRRRWEAKWGVAWRTHRHRPSPQYAQLAGRIRDVVQQLLPREATVLVVSKGDDELLKLGDCRAWHFPQTQEGVYTGHHPKDSEAAISALETLRQRGARFLVFPKTAFWWIAHYAAFAEHLERQHQLIFREEDVGVIYALRAPHTGIETRS